MKLKGKILQADDRQVLFWWRGLARWLPRIEVTAETPKDGKPAALVRGEEAVILRVPAWLVRREFPEASRKKRG